MKRKTAAVIGFGVGALTVLALIAVASRPLLHSQGNPVANSATASPSPSPTALTSPPSSAAPGPQRASPGSRAGAVMVYDPENRGVILFGGATTVHQPDGTNPATFLDDTWLWDGARWKRIDVQGPQSRSGAMAAYDSVRHLIVLFGGSGPQGIGQGQYFQDTWTWDGTQWQLQHPAHIPNPRMRAGMAFDERRGVVVMFGGEGETTYTATWTWDGADWTLQDPATVPPARHFAGMAYDAARGETVLFGGSMGGARLNDTWTWDGTNWTRRGAPAPSASGWSVLTYDAANREVVGYVYFALDDHPVAEYTITWDGARWTDRTSSADPSPRAETAIAYDPDTRQVVLHGGTFIDPQPFADTWLRVGSKWSLWEPAGSA